MRNSVLIPSRAICMNLDGNEDDKQFIDTLSMTCVIKPCGGDVYIKAKGMEADEDAFVVSDGEAFEFCGRITVFSKAPLKLHCLYCNTL